MLRKAAILLVSLIPLFIQLWCFIRALQTGKVTVGRGYVKVYYRNKEPRDFWIAIILGLVFGVCIFFVGLYAVFYLK